MYESNLSELVKMYLIKKSCFHSVKKKKKKEIVTKDININLLHSKLHAFSYKLCELLQICEHKSVFIFLIY